MPAAWLFQAPAALPSRAGDAAPHTNYLLPRPARPVNIAAMLLPFIKSFGAFFLAGLLFPSLCADIAPTTFVGSGIVPKDNGTIKMRSAKVDITWGAPCALKAVFEMENTTGSAQGVTVGFCKG
ncbi:MAG: hypothetical protein LBC18_15265 [Opitutaceae bacterium]|nr:hypothetical protein [Opitutaceae bacterium]